MLTMCGPCPRCRFLADAGPSDLSSPLPCPACGYLPSGAVPSDPTPAAPLSPDQSTFEQTPPHEPAVLPEPAPPAPAYGPYRVVGLIGRGGMGVVYRARHVRTQCEVAVKTVRARKRDVLRWFRREMHTLTRIRHRGLVRVLESGQTDGLPWYAMELLRGRTLYAYLREAWGRSASGSWRAVESVSTSNATGSLPTSGLADAPPAPSAAHGPGDRPPMLLSPAGLRDFLTLLARLCDVLAYLHGEGVVHRDLKPQNIIIRPDGTPVLFDFGLASSFGAGGREHLEVGGEVEGTPKYMAPEQVLGDYVDARADLYAVGCILYEGATGHAPFVVGTTAGILGACVRDEPVPPGRLVAGVPAALEDLILRLLAKRPCDRLGHARAAIAALARLGAECGDRAAESIARDYLYRPGFVGRDAVLELLEGRIHEGLAGGGRCVFLRGRSGAGKTRTLMELARRLKLGDGLTVVIGECLPTGGGSPDGPSLRSGPLHPFRPLLQAVADVCLEMGPSAARRLLGPRGKVLAACEPSLAALPGLEQYPDPPPQSHDAVRARLMDALGETLAAFAHGAPFVLLLDDLQWADELTLHFLALFQAGAWGAPAVAVVGAYRSEDERSLARKCGPAFEGAAFADLGPLDEASLHDIMREMLAADRPAAEDSPERLLRRLARRSEGNPFFVAELLRASVAGGALYRDEGGRWRVRLPSADADEAPPLPESLHDLIVRRLEGLSPDARRCLEMAAVLGREFEAELFEGDGLLDAGLPELLAAQILEEHQPGVFRFPHDKLREVVYAQIPADRRRELHRTAALAVEARFAGREDFDRHHPTLAHHWHESIGDRRAEPDRVARAVDYLEKSAGQATRSGLALKAVEHGLAAARLLGADVPAEPEAIAAALTAELEEIRRLLAGRDPLDLLDLPPSDDPELDRLIGLLQAIHPAAHMSNQYHLSAFLAVANLGLTLRRGRGAAAPSVYCICSAHRGPQCPRRQPAGGRLQPAGGGGGRPARPALDGRGRVPAGLVRRPLGRPDAGQPFDLPGRCRGGAGRRRFPLLQLQPRRLRRFPGGLGRPAGRGRPHGGGAPRPDRPARAGRPLPLRPRAAVRSSPGRANAGAAESERRPLRRGARPRLHLPHDERQPDRLLPHLPTQAALLPGRAARGPCQRRARLESAAGHQGSGRRDRPGLLPGPGPNDAGGELGGRGAGRPPGGGPGAPGDAAALVG